MSSCSSVRRRKSLDGPGRTGPAVRIRYLELTGPGPIRIRYTLSPFDSTFTYRKSLCRACTNSFCFGSTENATHLSKADA